MTRRTLDTYSNTGEEFPGLPVNSILYVLGTDEKTCLQREEEFLGLSVEEQKLRIVYVAPTTPTEWVADDCAGSDNWKIFDPGDGTGGFISIDGTTPDPTPNPNPDPNPVINNLDDQAGWENLGVTQSNQNK